MVRLMGRVGRVASGTASVLRLFAGRSSSNPPLSRKRMGLQAVPVVKFRRVGASSSRNGSLLADFKLEIPCQAHEFQFAGLGGFGQLARLQQHVEFLAQGFEFQGADER